MTYDPRSAASTWNQLLPISLGNCDPTLSVKTSADERLEDEEHPASACKISH